MNNGPYILLVDDDSAIREFVSMALGEEGYEIVAVADGNTALDLTSQRPPALLLVDIRMPEMDGHTFINNYRSTTKQPAPILVLTAGRGIAEAVASLDAAGYLAKPFDLTDLLSLVGQYMQ